MYDEDKLDDDRIDAEWEAAILRKEKRAKDIWRDTKPSDREDYYLLFLQREGLTEHFREWMMTEINADYPED